MIVPWVSVLLGWSGKWKWSRSVVSLCDPTDCRVPGSPVHGIFQARILVWVAISFSRGSSWPRVQIHVSCIAGRFFTTSITKGAVCAKLLSCGQPCDPMDYRLPGSPVHGIFQARILECVAISFSRGSSRPRDWTHVPYISCTGGQVRFFYH